MTLAWIGFLVLILGLLALDLGVFHRRERPISIRESLYWSAGWVSLALAFNSWVYVHVGSQAGLAFLTGYLIEKALSVDNLFVFLVIFSYFRVPARYQHQVLFWGILSALVLRAAFIFAGVALVERFHASIYLMGAFLLATAFKMLTQRDEQELDPAENPVLRFLQRRLPLVQGFAEGRFFVREQGRWKATTLFLVLVMIELTDLVFAVDSIPAILAITTDPFLVFTSNVMAILGLRSLYFALAGLLRAFHYLHYGLAFILGFVGFKMLTADLLEIPVGISLGLVAASLAAAVAASWWWPRQPEPDQQEEPDSASSP